MSMKSRWGHTEIHKAFKAVGGNSVKMAGLLGCSQKHAHTLSVREGLRQPEQRRSEIGRVVSARTLLKRGPKFKFVWTRAESDRAAKLYAGGMSYYDLSKVFNRPWHSIRNEMRRRTEASPRCPTCGR